MRIPLLSKKTKKVLDKNQERLVDLTAEQQQKILENPKIQIDKKLQQLLQENNELRILLEDKEDEISKTIRQGGTYVIEVGNGIINFEQVQVSLENSLKLRKREIDIRYGSFVGKIKGFFSRKQFRCWFVETEGEYTFDPRDKTAIEVKKQNEMQLRLGKRLAKGGFVDNILSDLGKFKRWWEYLPHILFVVNTFFFLLFMGLFFGQYNMIKT